MGKHAVEFDALPASCSYSLLALPIDLLTTIEDLEIRGSRADSAVLCTSTRTFSLRGVQSSNSLMLCRKDDTGRIQISTTLNETLEVVPTRAKTDRLLDLLRGTEYAGEDSAPSKESLLPASNYEIVSSLRAYRAILFNSQARLVAPMYLRALLSALLKTIESRDTKGKEVHVPQADAEMTFDSLECEKEACRTTLEWFGHLTGDIWNLDVEQIVKEIGTSLLAEGGYTERPIEPFVLDWQASVGPFQRLCRPELLRETALVQPRTIMFYPRTRLSSDPATRFGELFGAKAKWREADLVPFLEDFGGKKERDKLVMKFVRKVREKDGEYWVSRNNW